MERSSWTPPSPWPTHSYLLVLNINILSPKPFPSYMLSCILTHISSYSSQFNYNSLMMSNFGFLEKQGMRQRLGGRTVVWKMIQRHSSEGVRPGRQRRRKTKREGLLSSYICGQLNPIENFMGNPTSTLVFFPSHHRAVGRHRRKSRCRENSYKVPYRWWTWDWDKGVENQTDRKHFTIRIHRTKWQTWDRDESKITPRFITWKIDKDT